MIEEEREREEEGGRKRRKGRKGETHQSVKRPATYIDAMMKMMWNQVYFITAAAKEACQRRKEDADMRA